LVLDCGSRRDAETIFAAIHSYLLAGTHRRLLETSFTGGEGGRGNVVVQIVSESGSMVIEIEDIDWSIVERLETSLQVFSYYIVVAGWSEGEHFLFLPISDNHLLKADVVVNGHRTIGHNAIPVEWTQLISSLDARANAASGHR